MALDISKAYDSVCRVNMDRIMDWVGVSDCYFYRLYCAARDQGKVYVTSATGLSAPFGTFWGIQ